MSSLSLTLASSLSMFGRESSQSERSERRLLRFDASQLAGCSARFVTGVSVRSRSVDRRDLLLYDQWRARRYSCRGLTRSNRLYIGFQGLLALVSRKLSLEGGVLPQRDAR